MMSSPPRPAWYVGQEVLLTSSSPMSEPRIVKIERVTPTGRLRVDGDLFSPQGTCIRSFWIRRIRPATDGDREQVARHAAWDRIQRIAQQRKPPEHLTTAGLQTILMALTPAPTEGATTKEDAP